jgi:hypothetical protein
MAASGGGAGGDAARARVAHKRRPASSALLAAAAVVIAVAMLSSARSAHAYDDASPISYGSFSVAGGISSSAGRHLAAAAAPGASGNNDTTLCGLFGCGECKAPKDSQPGALPTCAKCLSGFKKAKGGCVSFWRL